MSDSEREDLDLVTRHLVMEKDLNPDGHVFGGAMLAWLDEAMAVYTMEHIGFTDFVTVALDEVNFKSPGHRGDIITIYARILKIGTSSITVEARAINHEIGSGLDRDIITCKFTFVCLKDHKAYPYFKSPEFAAWRERYGHGRNGHA